MAAKSIEYLQVASDFFLSIGLAFWRAISRGNSGLGWLGGGWMGDRRENLWNCGSLGSCPGFRNLREYAYQSIRLLRTIEPGLG